jgi:SAM-dependent methyltransferase
MPESMLVDVLHTVETHPWWWARGELTLALLRKHGVHAPSSILDVGCGWGVNIEVLERAGYNLTGLDISRRILELIDKPDRRLIEADIAQKPPPLHESFDSAISLDVIEHIDDDHAAVRRMADFVRPGGILVLSVPAMPELFSEFDEIQGHRRRYTPALLRAAFEESGFSLLSTLWWGAWMVPILRRTRKRGAGSAPPTYADYLRLPRWPGAHLMKAAFALEKPWALAGSLPMGTSLFAIARRVSSGE